MACTWTTLLSFILPIYIFTHESTLNFHFIAAWLIPLQRLEKVKTCQCRCVCLEVNVSLNGQTSWYILSSQKVNNILHPFVTYIRSSFKSWSWWWTLRDHQSRNSLFYGLHLPMRGQHCWLYLSSSRPHLNHLAPSDNCSLQPITSKVVDGPFKSWSLTEYTWHLIQFPRG